MTKENWYTVWETKPKTFVFAFMVVLRAIAHYLVVPGQFLWPKKLGTQFERRRQKLIVFAFYGRFLGNSTLFRGPDTISRPHDTWYTVWDVTLKTRRFRGLWTFCGLLHTVLGSRGHFYAPLHLVYGFRGNPKNSSFSRFMTVLWAIKHYFGLLGPFLGPMTLGTWF
jgi:hypothetical protein